MGSGGVISEVVVHGVLWRLLSPVGVLPRIQTSSAHAIVASKLTAVLAAYDKV